MRQGLRRGLLEGSQPWLVVGIVAGGAVLYRRIAHPAPEIVERVVVEPGSAVLVRVDAPAG
jgi:hypothetical protein